jgi:dTDP-glucose pyrophosphorylase
MTTALIMAGGRSSRMRASRGGQHKALVKVLGVSMLERNILTLLSHDFREIFLAVGALERSILACARGHCQKLVRANGAKLRLFIEKRPYGTIGAARAIRTSSDDLLVVNVDNLTSLDLTAFLEHHRASKAVLTIATHIEPFQVPFGQVLIKDGEIVEYREKPILRVPLCSGTYVLSKAARMSIPFGRPSSAPELVNILLRAKRKVVAFSHSAEWIDVNDAVAIEKAEDLLMAKCRAFELWRQPTTIESTTLCVLNKRKVALLRSPSPGPSPVPRLPVADLVSPRDTPLRSAYRLRKQMGLLGLGKPHLLACFDELDPRNAQRTRHHIFVAEMKPAGVRTHKRTISWAGVSDLDVATNHINGGSRTIAYLQRYVASKNPHPLSYR